MTPEAATLIKALRCDDRPLLVCTGAGISLASGVPTFRGTDPGAVWAAEVTEKGTRAWFSSHPVESWLFYLARFSALGPARPNPAHHAVQALLEWCVARNKPALLVTQNIDTLHEQAGSRVVKVHGSADRVRCSKSGCKLGAPAGVLPMTEVDFTAFRATPTLATVPRCPRCASLLRPHVLWFDERYDEHRAYEIERVNRAAKHAGLTLFIGTSFSVGVTQMLLERSVARGTPFSIDPVGAAPHRKVERLACRAETLLPEVAAELSA